MSRTVALLIMLTFSMSLAEAQEYYVIQVKGTVKKSEGTILTAGQTINANDKLIFGSATDAVAVANAKSGRFVIQAKPTAKPGEFISFVKDAITPGVKRLSTRHGELNTLVDFQTSFKEIHLLLPELKYRVNAANFPLSENSFFFIRFAYNGEVINKKINWSADTIIINREQLFTIDGNKIEATSAQDLKLYYFTNGTSQLITSLRFDVTSQETLQSDAHEFAKVYPKDDRKLKEELFLFLNEFYGKVDEGNFNRWFAGLAKGS